MSANINVKALTFVRYCRVKRWFVFLFLFSLSGFVLFSHFSFVTFATIMYVNVCVWRFFVWLKRQKKRITHHCVGYTQFTMHFPLYVTLKVR